MAPTRRAIMQGALGVVTTTAARAFDAGSEFDIRAAYRKLRYRLGGGVVFWWMDGVKYAQNDAEITPLFGMDIGAWFQIADVPEGGYTVTSYELVFYRDLATGAVIREWKNPYTGEVVPITNRPIGPTLNRYDGEGRFVLPTTLGGAAVTADNRISLMKAAGNDIWVSDDYTASVTPPGGGAPFVVNDWSAYHGRLDQVSDVNVADADATCTLQEVTGWQRWMKMGDRPGTLTSRAIGRKVADFGQMPQRYRDAVAAAYPDIARDPLAAFTRPPETFAR